MTSGTEMSVHAGALGNGSRRPGEAGAAARGMRFSVDGWDPGYGTSLELDGELGESTARVETGVEVPADRWRPVDPAADGPLPDALLFVDGVRRVEARVWIDGAAQPAPVGPPPAARLV